MSGTNSIGPNGLNSSHTKENPNLPTKYAINAFTYYNGSGYTNKAAGLVVMPSGGEAYIRASLYKKGDLNYSSQNVHIDFEFHQWGSSTGVYNIKAKGVGICDSGSTMWVDSNRRLWWHNNNQWSQYQFLIVHEMSSNVTIDCSSIMDMHNYSGQTRYNVDINTTFEREASWGS